ncbi:MAG: FTR1 family protein [Burkholderiales bacterium]|nr:FTR1 family protein [Burkholderiales bacterium]
MLATAIIVFREVLEAALVVGIVLAATRGVLQRGLWVSAGALAGLLGAAVVAWFAEAIAAAASGVGQEIFNAAVLFVAVIMLGWHNVWMSRHGRELASSLKSVGAAVRSGTSPMHVLAAVVGMAVLREGSELVLFLYGVAASASGNASGMLGGALVGVGAGAAVGATLYLGLLRIPSSRLFTVTGWMILLLAAGMAGQGAAFLVQADILPALGQTVWDTTALIADDGVLGQVLHTLIGYTARPYGIQVLFYLATLGGIVALMKIVNHSPNVGAIPGAGAAGAPSR